MRARPNSAALKKRKRFLGRPNFAHAPALCETPSCPAYFNTSLFSARGLMPAGLRKYAFSFLYKNAHKSNFLVFAARSVAPRIAAKKHKKAFIINIEK